MMGTIHLSENLNKDICKAIAFKIVRWISSTITCLRGVKLLNKSNNYTKMLNTVSPEQNVGESILLAEVKISKQLKLSEQTAEGTAETTQNTVIQDCLRFM